MSIMGPCIACGDDICTCEFDKPFPGIPMNPDVQRFVKSHRPPILRSSILPFEKANLSYDLRVVTVKLMATVPFWPKHLVIAHSQAEHVRVRDLLVGHVTFMPTHGSENNYLAGDFFSSLVPQEARVRFGMPRISPGQEVVLRVSGTNLQNLVLQAAMQVELEDYL